MRDSKKDLTAIFAAGIAAVAPGAAILRHAAFDNDLLLVDGEPFWNAASGGLYAVGAGKGTAPMAAAFEQLAGGRIADGFVVVKTGHGLPLASMRIGEAAHPVPDEAGQAASAAILEIAARCRHDDLLVCLLSGGASALTPAPAPGLGLADLAVATSLLLACGADIREINAMRKHLSIFSGGQLARAANGAKVLSLIISDVIGDDLATIASGPTAPDPATYADCLAILDKYDLLGRFPANALRRLEDGANGKAPETPKPGDAVFARVRNVIAASNGQALAACASEARALGYEPRLVTGELHGEARDAAAWLVEQAKKAPPKSCLLAGGETTVTLKGGGLGGRNQEMALAAAISLAGNGEIRALFAGTDGTDGPTDAAGGFAFGDTMERMGGMEKARRFLAANDSYRALRKAGDLFVTGPSLTNVMDLAILLVD